MMSDEDWLFVLRKDVF